MDSIDVTAYVTPARFSAMRGLFIARALLDAAPPNPSGQVAVGETWNFQFLYRDLAGGGALFNLTDGLGVTFCP